MKTGCRLSEAADHTCDASCLTAQCGFDADDCACSNVLTEPFGYRSDRELSDNDHPVYANSADDCWLIQPTGEFAGRPIALTFARFDTETNFDYLEVYGGPLIDAPLLSRRGDKTGFSGSYSAPKLPELARNTSGGHGDPRDNGMLLKFHTDFSRPRSGFMFGWTVLTSDGKLPRRDGYCAEGCRNSMRGDGHCDAACMNGFCGWDNADCTHEAYECAPGCSTLQLGDGVCHTACLVKDCDWDRRDCECTNVLDTEAGYASPQPLLS